MAGKRPAHGRRRGNAEAGHRSGARNTEARRRPLSQGARTGHPADGSHAPTVLVLSGGAPNGALTAGALAAIYLRGKAFDTVYTSGAGALIGMLYKAPKGMTADKALASLKEFGIEDDIYRLFPVGYKTFFKAGPFTTTWLKLAQKIKLTDASTHGRRLYNDLVDFWGAATCPTTASPFSLGLCAPPPFIQNCVDFDLLNSPKTPGRFFMNAYCIETGTMVEFDRTQHTLTPQHFNAALSYPFIYSPTRIDDKHYFEGGCVDPLNLTGLADHISRHEIVAKTVVLIDILGALRKALVRVPRNLWDAYGISILLPVVALAEKNEALFLSRIDEINQDRSRAYPLSLVKLEFEIDPGHFPLLTDWTRSNMEICWAAGFRAGNQFVDQYGASLPNRSPGDDSSEPAVRAGTTVADRLLRQARRKLHL